MTALQSERVRDTFYFKHLTFTLKSGNKAWRGAALFYEFSSQKVVPALAAAGAGYMYLGKADETVDATAADKEVSIDLHNPFWGAWYVNHTASDAVAATDLLKIAYFQDDQTVTITSSGRTPAGRIWKVSSQQGVLVEKLQSFGPAPVLPPTLAASLGEFVAGDLEVPASLAHDSVNDIPTTAANSTVTLPAAAPDGTRWTFVADGSKNGHTVQYRDATGTTNLTTALTASKRHLAICVKHGGKWFVTSAVSP